MERCLRLVIECTVTMSLVSLALLALTPFLAKRYSARCLYAAWMVVLLGFVMPLRPQPGTPPITVTVRPYEAIWRQTPAREGNPANAAAQPEPSLSVQTTTMEAAPLPAPGGSPLSFLKDISLATVLTAAWVAGAALCALLRLLAHRRFLHTVKRWGKPVRDERILFHLAALCREMGIRRPVVLRLCPSVDSPMLVGLLRPVILLPDERLPTRELELVLRHELTHLRRGDLWGRALLLLASAAHWFNPVLPLVARAVAFQCEAACDEAVMKHTDYETRVYYSHTILKIIKSRTGVATALSTRYNGGFKEMKKRIAHILDRKKKRLGMMIILIIAAAALGAGMAFALAPEAAVEPEPPAAAAPEGMADATANMPLDDQLQIAYDKQMADALTERLQALISQYGDALREEDPLLDTYAVRPNATEYMGAWDDVTALFDACVDGESLAALLRSPVIYTTSTAGTEVIRNSTDNILKAAGFAEEMPHRSYMISGNWYLGPGEATNLVPMWQVYAGGPSTPDSEAYQTVIMVMSGEGRLYSLVASEAATYHEAIGYTSEAERQTARESAIAFAKEHVLMVNAALDIAVVSSRSYPGELEPFTLVWLFDYAVAETSDEAMPYNAQNHAGNQGTQIAVGLESGKILSITPGCSEGAFVVGNEADVDWAAQMGRPYPFESDDYYVCMVVGPQIGNMILTLLERYREALSEEEILVASHMAAIGDNPWAYISANGDWERLLSDLTACALLEDFKAVLHGDYGRINQSPADEPTREEILSAATAALDAAGYGEWTLRSFMYSGWNSSGGYPGYEIRVSYPSAPESEPPVSITVSREGKLRLIDGPYPEAYQDDNSADPRLTAEEKERYRALALLLTTEQMDTGNSAVEAEGIWVNDRVFELLATERFVQVQVPLTFTFPDGQTGWYCYDMLFIQDGGRLCRLVQSGGDRESYYERTQW